MLVIEQMRGMPVLTRIGLALMVAAFVADLIVHLAAVPHEHAGHRPEEHFAHLAGLLGMVLVLAGIVVDGARRHRS